MKISTKGANERHQGVQVLQFLSQTRSGGIQCEPSTTSQSCRIWSYKIRDWPVTSLCSYLFDIHNRFEGSAIIYWALTRLILLDLNGLYCSTYASLCYLRLSKWVASATYHLVQCQYLDCKCSSGETSKKSSDALVISLHCSQMSSHNVHSWWCGMPVQRRYYIWFPGSWLSRLLLETWARFNY